MRKNEFLTPPARFRTFPIQHSWPENRSLFLRALKDYGFGGVVTNVPFAGGFTQNPANLAAFGEILSELTKEGLSYWIYDEQGYPSGYAGGEVLKGHPELEAKGFYMRRRVAYTPRHTTFQIDEETDKIVWAAKYPLHIERIDDGHPIYEKMQPVPFTDTFCQCDLAEREVLFVFCVKPAYEGSHCTHNVCSFSRYINVMEPAAVRRFIDLCFEPVAKALPAAYANSVAVFTDEPSLQVAYARPYESWPYALAPWKEGLFGDFEAEYGFDLRPYLPLLFEGGQEAWPIRVLFYELVGKLIAKAYSGQLQKWCAARGTAFSGHYLIEESLARHALDYGNYLTVLRAAGYPGLDVLSCVPRHYDYNTAKHPQMAARKNNTNGMMVEICPFSHAEEFAQNPAGHMKAIMGLLYASGVRQTTSYFSSDYSAYAPAFSGMKGFVNQAESADFNAYVGRLGYALDGLSNRCGVFVYYALEDAQAKLRPQHSSPAGPEGEADRSARRLARTIYEAGHDFYYADAEDLWAGAQTGEISGNRVEAVLVPAMDVMHASALNALLALQERGIPVWFLDRAPSFVIDGISLQEVPDLAASPLSSILSGLDALPRAFSAVSDGPIVKACFEKGGRELWLLQNIRGEDIAVTLHHHTHTAAEVWSVARGDVSTVSMGGNAIIPAFSAVFVLF